MMNFKIISIQISFLISTLLLLNCQKREKVIQYYKSGAKYSEGYKVENKDEGEVIVFHPNGKVDLILNYKNGVMNGLYQEYYLNGKLKLVQYMENDSINGPFKIYYENGNFKEVGYCIRNKKEGESIEYYYNGNVKEISNYNNDQINGRHLMYSITGKLIIDAFYNNGKYIKGLHYNYKKDDDLIKAYGIRIGDIQKLYHEDSSLFFVKNLSNNSYIEIYSKDDVGVLGILDFLTKADSLNFNKYYPNWKSKISIKKN